MLGMRFTFSSEMQRPWLTDGTADWLWPAAERAGIPIMLSVPGSLPAVDKIAERHPALRLVIDHLALGRGKKGDDAFTGLPELCALARRPNVAVKASSLPSYTTEPYPFRGLYPHIRRVCDAFGPRRMFWGTDWTRLTCPWRQAVTLFTEELPWLSADDKTWIMGHAICDWLAWAGRWKRPICGGTAPSAARSTWLTHARRDFRTRSTRLRLSSPSRVRLARGLRAPPRSWTFLIGLRVLQQPASFAASC